MHRGVPVGLLYCPPGLKEAGKPTMMRPGEARLRWTLHPCTASMLLVQPPLMQTVEAWGWPVGVVVGDGRLASIRLSS
jgi:hypothetical protein